MVTGIYNVNIDPLVSEANKIKVDRDVTFSSAAMHFLQSQGYDLKASITDGVTYLSRAEHTKALVDFGKRQETFNNPTRQLLDDISSYDHETIAFVRDAANQIKLWIDAGAAGLATQDHVAVDIVGGTQNRYRKKILHELLRSQFSDYRAYQPDQGATFMKVVKIDPEREANVTAGRKMVFEAALKKETGFRFVIEALFGGDISGIDSSWFAVNYDGNSQWINVNQIERDMAEIGNSVKTNHKSRLLVGHNVFMDLAFLYQTFIGDLPERIEDFQAVIHELLPNVIDTKFIATSIEHSGYQDSSSLAELSNKYKSVVEPVIDIPERFRGYSDTVKLHEAGYDSWICAQACVRMISTMQKKHGTGVPAQTGSPTNDEVIAQFANASDLEDPEFKKMLSTLTCGPETPLGTTPVPGGPYNLVNGQPRNTAFIFDISHPWYEFYMNKLRVFRCEETVCDLNPRQSPPAHMRFAGPSMDVRNYGDHQAQVGASGPIQQGYHGGIQYGRGEYRGDFGAGRALGRGGFGGTGGRYQGQ